MMNPRQMAMGIPTDVTLPPGADPAQTMRQMALMMMMQQGMMPEGMPGMEMPQGEPTMRQKAIQIADTPLPTPGRAPMGAGSPSMVPADTSSPMQGTFKPTQGKASARRSVDLVEAQVE